MRDFRGLSGLSVGYLVYSLERGQYFFNKGKPLAFFKREEDAYTCYPDKRKFKIVPVNKGKLAKILLSGFK